MPTWKPSPQAVALMRKVKRNIVKHPETYNQGTFYQHDDKVPTGKFPKGLCGTTGCIAMHVVLAAELDIQQPDVLTPARVPRSELAKAGIRSKTSLDISEAARRLLKVSRRRIFDLFQSLWEIDDIYGQRLFTMAYDQKRDAKTACRRIDYWLKHGI